MHLQLQITAVVTGPTYHLIQVGTPSGNEQRICYLVYEMPDLFCLLYLVCTEVDRFRRLQPCTHRPCLLTNREPVCQLLVFANRKALCLHTHIAKVLAPSTVVQSVVPALADP